MSHSDDEYLTGVSISAVITFALTLILAVTCNQACDSVHNLQCDEDGYYSVLIEDDETDEEVRSKTNRKCKDVATSSDTKSTPISLERPKEESSKPEFDKGW